MNYRVEIDYAPAYELIASLDAFLYTPAKSLDLGSQWVDDVRARLSGPLAEMTAWESGEADAFALVLLLWQCPVVREPEPFLAWLNGLSAGQMYELLAPYTPAGATDLLRNLSAKQEYYVRTLTAWYEQYFQSVDPAIPAVLAASAATLQAKANALAPAALVDEATTGVVVESEGLEMVLLIPQYHFRPLNNYRKAGPVFICMYPVDLISDEPGKPSLDLLRLTKALGDENRLRILHFLADSKTYSFTDVLKASGLSRTTTYYHLSTLRAAGLVRIHLTGGCSNERYTARRATLAELSDRLERFLDRRD